MPSMSNSKPSAKIIVIPLYDAFELLDVTGPVEVLGYMHPTPEIHLVADKVDTPVCANPGNVKMVSNNSFAHCPQADILLVPGGSGQVQKMVDPQYIQFLQCQAEGAEYVTSVCVGSLLLAAAGLLNGYVATTHWDSQSVLNLFPEVTLAGGYPRYVVCGNRMTSGGVSSGIDMALALVGLLYGDQMAKVVQLLIEYEPSPPYHSGQPDVADPWAMGKAAGIVDTLREQRFEEVKAILAREE